ncbi:MAG: hypothetical protein EHM12_08755 [Dehalococcoidia bacterium]|nr:MAG: hypothetical protein EHM12_08755 [Dehalococcoidia bacterium]
MDFEQTRREVLNNLLKMKKEKRPATPIASPQKKPAVQPGNVSTAGDPAQKKQILIYGKESLFIKNTIQELKSRYIVTCFNDEEKACACCIDSGISHVLLDMDPPTDWRMATDVFTTIKTQKPDVHFILFTKKTTSVEVKTLANQGAAIIAKPVSFQEVHRQLSNAGLK